MSVRDEHWTAPAQELSLARRKQIFAEAYRRERLRTWRIWLVGGGVFVVMVIAAADIGEVDLVHLWDRLPRFRSYFGRMVPDISLESLWPDLQRWFRRGWVWLRALWETVLIALYATSFGCIAAYFVSFLAADNLSPHPAVRFVARRTLEFARTIPELVYAIIFVFSFGIGPLAGVLALALHSFGAVGKLFADVAENCDREQIRGVRATGANWMQTMIYGATPQLGPDFLSYGLYRLEINVRAASVLGFVGAGGIGQELYNAIKTFRLTDASAISLMLIAAVIAVDMLSSWLRGRVIGKGRLSEA